jgi:signal peptidase I
MERPPNQPSQEYVGSDIVTTSTEIVVFEEVLEIRRPPAHPPVSLGAILMDRVRSMLAVLVLAIFILTFLVQPFRIPSESMERTLLVGDFLLVNKAVYGPAGIWGWLLPYRGPHRGDIVVFRFPLDGEDHVVKRVIGAPGDRIHLRNSIVYRNDQPLLEPYTRQPSAWPRSRPSDAWRDNFPNARYTDPGVDAHWWAQLQRSTFQGDLYVPADSYFVMGDNRNDSRDSRYWGFVPRANIVGMPMLIYFSVREPSRTGPFQPPGDAAQDDRLGNSAGEHFLRFARWGRTLRVVY